MTSSSWFYYPLAFLMAFFLTWAVRKYAIERNVIDVPNARSSHTRPTPRGGGVAFVATFLLLGLVSATLLPMNTDAATAILGAGLLIALVGFLDDHGHIPARWRLVAHFSAAIWVLYWLGGPPPVTLFGLDIPAAWPLSITLALVLVWLLNLYNFMDGIDGIASAQAICVSVGGALLYLAQGLPDMAFYPLLLACSVAGFLVWNFPPARIFMGDAGSGFLGLTLGGLTIQAAWIDERLFWSWIILSGVFIADATWTLVRRLLRKEKVYEAHRSHGYQFASRKLGAHRPVTLAVIAINIFWLFPMAYWAWAGAYDPALITLLAYTPLCLLAYLFRAGAPE
ncbi:MraY family glycosyltransferase [Alcaligenes aquatilis]|uniref:Glycosyltransferase family 4 protein n=1 Tax=Alcaligenes aquatilis TaxID=323284 RepID=A0A3G2HZD1_9BURK|nr:glycosyltransferase family 4 protein [Alcaligenes aquatilis]AYN22221.1 glycosyltransferase family 4 protein [Alcaligenes aquatilis]